MSDWLADTPNLGRRWCPQCEPEADPLREILVVHRCDSHYQAVDGLDDGRATTSGRYLTGSAEAESDDCRKYAELIHRGRCA